MRDLRSVYVPRGRSIIKKGRDSSRKNKRPPPICCHIATVLFLVLCFFLRSDNLLAVIVTAATAYPMRKIVFTTVRALYHAGHIELPNVGTSFVSACLRCFSLRYSHDHTSLGTIGRIFTSTLYYSTPIPVFQVVFSILQGADRFLFSLPPPLSLHSRSRRPAWVCRRSGITPDSPVRTARNTAAR